MNPSIFKAYDIRGIYPSEINGESAYIIGQALADYTKAKKIVVGWDMRISSPEISKELIRGINEQGCDVVVIGLASTPMLYFASWKMQDVDAGVIITASHNPAKYNGMKFCLKGAVPIGEGSGMEEIRDLAMENTFVSAEKKGTVQEDEGIKQIYYDYIADFWKGGNKKKIVIDFANGMGILDKPIYEKIAEDIEAVYLYDKLDGGFPNHEANPIKKETLVSLQKKVVEEKVDLGIAYDGDADRVGFVAENGEIIPMDYITAILAEEVLKKHPGGLVLMDLRSSNAVKEKIEASGGKVNCCRVGHSLIKKQMREEGAIFAGELSGHYFFEENSKAEMPTFAAIMILNLLNETGLKISEIIKDLKKYFQSGEINSEVADKIAVFKKIKEKYADGQLDELDGIRIDYSEWWFNVRASNTEPVIRLNVEAKTKELMEEKRDELLGTIRI
jgi:phosphomannomutase